MAAPRKWTPEQCAEVIRRHIMGQTTRQIGKAVGRNQSVVSRLLNAPDIAAIVAEEQAKIGAAENEQAHAVKRERERKQGAARQQASRDRKVKAKIEAERRESLGHMSGGGDGRLLPVHITGVRGVPGIPDDDGWVRGSGPQVSGIAPTPAELDDIERRLYPEKTLHASVRWLDADGKTLASRSYNVLHDGPDTPERVEVADWLLGLGAPFDRNELITALSNASPGGTVVLAFEEPNAA